MPEAHFPVGGGSGVRDLAPPLLGNILGANKVL